MRTRKLAAVISAGLLLFFACGSCWADLYVESEQVNRGVPGQAEGSAMLKQYLSADATMTDLGDRIIIMDLKEKMFYEMDKATKTYKKNSIEKMGLSAITGEDTEEVENNPMVQAMLKTLSQSFKITPTSETKTVAGYPCRKYLVSVMMANSEYWVTNKFKGYDELKTIGQKTGKLLANNPTMKQMNVAGMIQELDGLPVQTITEIMGGTVTTTVKKIEQKKLDASLFKVPSGYQPAKEVN